MTFLVNVWLHHRPWGADPLHAPVKGAISTRPIETSWMRPTRPAERPVDSRGRRHRFELRGFGEHGDARMELSLPLSDGWRRARRAAAGSFLALRWRDDGSRLALAP